MEQNMDQYTNFLKKKMKKLTLTSERENQEGQRNISSLQEEKMELIQYAEREQEKNSSLQEELKKLKEKSEMDQQKINSLLVELAQGKNIIQKEEQLKESKKVPSLELNNEETLVQVKQELISTDCQGQAADLTNENRALKDVLEKRNAEILKLTQRNNDLEKRNYDLKLNLNLKTEYFEYDDVSV